MRIILIITLFSALTLTMNESTRAQDSNPDCNPTTVIKMASLLKSTGDKSVDMKALLDLQAQISLANIKCNGMVFKKTGAKIIGPITLPTGTYKTTVVTKSPGFIAEMKITKGTCTASGVMGMSGYLYNVMNMDGIQVEEENLIESNECTLMIATSNVIGNWILVIEPIQ